MHRAPRSHASELGFSRVVTQALTRRCRRKAVAWISVRVVHRRYASACLKCLRPRWLPRHEHRRRRCREPQRQAIAAERGPARTVSEHARPRTSIRRYAVARLRSTHRRMTRCPADGDHDRTERHGPQSTAPGKTRTSRCEWRRGLGSWLAHLAATSRTVRRSTRSADLATDGDRRCSPTSAIRRGRTAAAAIGVDRQRVRRSHRRPKIAHPDQLHDSSSSVGKCSPTGYPTSRFWSRPRAPSNVAQRRRVDNSVTLVVVVEVGEQRPCLRRANLASRCATVLRRRRP